jgi:hypothetical protein
MHQLQYVMSPKKLWQEVALVFDFPAEIAAESGCNKI